MIDLQYCIENFHKPRIGKLAEYLLNESEFPYDYFAPPVFETFMIQVKLSAELILSINYFPIEISDEAPYLFLQFHCLLAEVDGEPSQDLHKYLSLANNSTELSTFYINDNRLFMKSVVIDDPKADLDLDRIRFLLRIFYNNLVSHLASFRHIVEGGSIEGAISRK